MMINKQFKEFDIPVLCSVFMPAAFEYYVGYLMSVDIEIKDYYKQWNRALMVILKRGCFKKYCGEYNKGADAWDGDFWAGANKACQEAGGSLPNQKELNAML